MSKKLLKKIVAFLIAFLIAFIIIYSFLLSDYNPMFESKEFIYLTNKLKDAQKEDLKSFTDIYKIVNKNQIRSPSEITTSYIGPYRHGYSITKLIYELKIEKEFSADDCIKFLFLNTDYKHGNIGIREASKFYFKKTLKELSEKEKLILIAIVENPSLYDPIRNPEGVANRVRIYQMILHQQKN
jgi:hypothetical protein